MCVVGVVVVHVCVVLDSRVVYVVVLSIVIMMCMVVLMSSL